MHCWRRTEIIIFCKAAGRHTPVTRTCRAPHLLTNWSQCPLACLGTWKSDQWTTKEAIIFFTVGLFQRLSRRVSVIELFYAGMPHKFLSLIRHNLTYLSQKVDCLLARWVFPIGHLFSVGLKYCNLCRLPRLRFNDLDESYLYRI